ncbi:hypothetical protein VTP01DRAFT_7237 [Rhizomucor pusillus]|uniref:uncharacterized protein n=1 Tax=Rhizomucor pusillus TaxID=4840 RepID=UPI003742E547
MDAQMIPRTIDARRRPYRRSRDATSQYPKIPMPPNDRPTHGLTNPYDLQALVSTNTFQNLHNSSILDNWVRTDKVVIISDIFWSVGDLYAYPTSWEIIASLIMRQILDDNQR